MFLPDGKALIMDNDLYRETIEKSIVVDLIENQCAIQNQEMAPISTNFAQIEESKN